jgi:hypothetical protein
MGNSSGSCSREQNREGIIAREMRLYRWRSQNAGSCIPGLEFRDEGKFKQEEKLQEFVKQWKEKHYLQFSMLKEELATLEDKKEEVLVFEKYACSLDELAHCLSLE